MNALRAIGDPCGRFGSARFLINAASPFSSVKSGAFTGASAFQSRMELFLMISSI